MALTMLLQLVDVSRDRLADGRDVILLTGRTPDGAKRRVHVDGTPFECWLAVPHGWPDLDRVVRSLRWTLDRPDAQCRRSRCERCQADQPEPFHEPVDEEAGDRTVNSSACPFAVPRSGRDRFVSAETIPRRGMFGYEAQERPFVRFVFADFDASRAAANVLDKVDTAPLDPRLRGAYGVAPDAVSGFLELKGTSAFGWVRVPPDTPVVHFDRVEVVREQMPHARTRLLSVDIECFAEKVENCHPRQHPVGIVGLVTDELKEYVLALRPRPGCPVPEREGWRWFDRETDMLLALRDFIRAFEPDWLTGYASNWFDWPYLLVRADHLGIPEFRELVPGHRVRRVRADKTTNQTGTIACSFLEIPGIVFMDVASVYRESEKVSSYKLKDFAQDNDLPPKLDVAYELMYPMWKGGDVADLEKMCVYCLRDAEIPARGAAKKRYVDATVARAEVFRVTSKAVLDRGVTFLVGSMIRHHVRGRYLPPHVKFGELHRAWRGVPGMEALVERTKREGYVGGYVVEPIAGLNVDPMSIMDFSSLYPSEIRAYNMCYTTLVPDEHRTYEGTYPVPEGRYTCFTGHVFVAASERRGVLPEVLDMLLDARALAKTRCAAAERRRDRNAAAKKLAGDPAALAKHLAEFPDADVGGGRPADLDECNAEAAAQDARQGGYKIAANSVYGATGAPGAWQCYPVSQGTTAGGRQSLSVVCDFVRDLTKPGFSLPQVYGPKMLDELFPDMAELVRSGAERVYGDTDSAMIRFRALTQLPYDERIKALARVAEKLLYCVNNLLCMRKPLAMALENLVSISLFTDVKKRYAYLKVKDGKVAIKGIEVARRDFPPVCTRIMRKVLHDVLSRRFAEDPARGRADVAEYVHRNLTDLLAGRLPMEDLLCTSNLSKPDDEYAHPETAVNVQVARQARDAGEDVKSGDRVAFYYVKGKGKLVSSRVRAEKAFDPAKDEIDYEAYFEKTAPALRRLLQFVLSPVDELLTLCTYRQGGGIRVAMGLPPTFQAAGAHRPKRSKRAKLDVKAAYGSVSQFFGGAARSEAKREEAAKKEARPEKDVRDAYGSVSRFFPGAQSKPAE